MPSYMQFTKSSDFNILINKGIVKRALSSYSSIAFSSLKKTESAAYFREVVTASAAVPVRSPSPWETTNCGSALPRLPKRACPAKLL